MTELKAASNLDKLLEVDIGIEFVRGPLLSSSARDGDELFACFEVCRLPGRGTRGGRGTFRNVLLDLRREEVLWRQPENQIPASQEDPLGRHRFSHFFGAEYFLCGVADSSEGRISVSVKRLPRGKVLGMSCPASDGLGRSLILAPDFKG